MRALDRKLLRDLRRQWTQVLSISVLVACGTMAALGMRSTLGAVVRARASFYAEYRFAHVFASLERAPEALARRVALIPGVARVQTRVVATAALDVPGLDEPATGRLVSVEAGDAAAPPLNALHLRHGRTVLPGSAVEAVASERFAAANGLRPGDTLAAVIDGRWRRLRIVGLAMSPEYIYEEGGGGIIADSRLFGVLWMDRRALAAAYGMEGAFNDVALRLAPGAREDEVIAALDRLLGRHGGAGAYGRDEQPSNTVLADEVQQLGAMANLFPLFFIGTAAFLLNVVLSRLVATQREEIAALKAFGYTDLAIGLHFLGFAGTAVAVGGVLGVALGGWIGGQYTALYAEYFRLPDLRHRIDWAAAGLSFGVSGGAALLGALAAVRAAVRLPPAEALRPQAPARFRPLLVERVGLVHLLPPAVRLVMRNLERRPVRTLLTTVGVSLGGAILVTGMFPYDALDVMLDVQFRTAQREDLTVALARPVADAGLRGALAHVAGVTAVETFRALPVRVRRGHVVRSVGVVGLAPGGTMRRLASIDGRVHPVPPAGLVLSANLARALGARRGDTLDVEVTERDLRRRAVVGAVLDEIMGLAAYMDRRELNRLAGEGDVSSGALLAIERGAAPRVHRALKRLPVVAGVASRQAMIDQFERETARSIGITATIVILSACAITLGVVYNGAWIALSERGRELASLRVLGFTRREVAALLLGEQAVTTAAAIPLGCLVGYGFSRLLVHGFQSERFQFPLVITAGKYAFSALVVALAAALAAGSMLRRINRLDLIGVLKTRE